MSTAEEIGRGVGCAPGLLDERCLDKAENDDVEVAAEDIDSDCTPWRETEEVAGDRGGLNLLRLEYENGRECCALFFPSGISVSADEIGPVLGRAEASRATPFPADLKGESGRFVTGVALSDEG